MDTCWGSSVLVLQNLDVPSSNPTHLVPYLVYFLFTNTMDHSPISRQWRKHFFIKSSCQRCVNERPNWSAMASLFFISSFLPCKQCHCVAIGFVCQSDSETSNAYIRVFFADSSFAPHQVHPFHPENHCSSKLSARLLVKRYEGLCTSHSKDQGTDQTSTT